MPHISSWLNNVLIGLDQLTNAFTGGSGDETISSRTDRTGQGNILDRILNWFEDDHSAASLEYTPFGTVDPHHMAELNREIAQDWDCFIQVMQSSQDVDAFLPETLEAADRAAKRLRLWTKNGGKSRWMTRMMRDIYVGDSLI